MIGESPDDFRCDPKFLSDMESNLSIPLESSPLKPDRKCLIESELIDSELRRGTAIPRGTNLSEKHHNSPLNGMDFLNFMKSFGNLRARDPTRAR